MPGVRCVVNPYDHWKNDAGSRGNRALVVLGTAFKARERARDAETQLAAMSREKRKNP